MVSEFLDDFPQLKKSPLSIVGDRVGWLGNPNTIQALMWWFDGKQIHQEAVFTRDSQVLTRENLGPFRERLLRRIADMQEKAQKHRDNLERMKSIRMTATSHSKKTSDDKPQDGDLVRAYRYPYLLKVGIYRCHPNRYEIATGNIPVQGSSWIQTPEELFPCSRMQGFRDEYGQAIAIIKTEGDVTETNKKIRVVRAKNTEAINLFEDEIAIRQTSLGVLSWYYDE